VKRLVAAILVGLLSLTAFAAAPPAAVADCSFSGGFQALHDKIPLIVGACVGAEQPDPTSGNTVQATTAGYLQRSAADGRVNFTDGSVVWLDGPCGIQNRRDTDRFAWEVGRQGCQLEAVGAESWPGVPISATQPAAMATPSPTVASQTDLWDCSDFTFREDAQAVLLRDASDPNHLDPDGNGFACESVPLRPTPTPTQLPTRTPVPAPPLDQAGSDNGNDNSSSSSSSSGGDFSTEGPATAICKDGWVSHSQHRSGTCSHHGGVAQWL